MLKVSKEMIITWLNQFSSTQIEGDMTSFFLRILPFCFLCIPLADAKVTNRREVCIGIKRGLVKEKEVIQVV